MNVIDHGMSPQEAVEAPRIWTLGETMDVEEAFDDNVVDALATRGHTINRLRAVGAGMGMISFDGAMLTGASCWRADGTPIGIAGGMARSGLRFRV